MGKRLPIAIAIRTLDNEIKREMERSMKQKGKYDLTAIQFAIMGFISGQQEAVYQKDVEETFNIRRSSASSILKSLEEKGFIHRIPEKEDARLKKIIILPKAMKLHENVDQNIDTLEKRLRKGLQDAEIEQFYTLLDKFKSNLSDEKN